MEEDGEERACTLALAIVAAAKQLTCELGGEEGTLSVSVGIHAAVCIVGRLDGGGHTRPVAQGEAPSLAKKLRAAAGPSA